MLPYPLVGFSEYGQGLWNRLKFNGLFERVNHFAVAAQFFLGFRIGNIPRGKIVFNLDSLFKCQRRFGVIPRFVINKTDVVKGWMRLVQGSGRFRNTQ